MGKILRTKKLTTFSELLIVILALGLILGALYYFSPGLRVDAAKKLEDLGHSVEVIDLRTLAPLDMETIKESLSRTNRLMIAHEEHKTSGFAGEIAARVNEECFSSLDAPILRVCSKDTHVAYCPGLEEVILPQTNDVYDKLKELLEY